MTERKVCKMGGHSFIINIPKEICKKMVVIEKTIFDIELQDGKITLTKIK